MKLTDVRHAIDNPIKRVYRIMFERYGEDGILHMDYFPADDDGEVINDVEIAIKWAEEFSKSVDPRVYQNICVTDQFGIRANDMVWNSARALPSSYFF